MRTRKEVELTRRIRSVISSERFRHLILRTGIALTLLFVGFTYALDPSLLQTRAATFGKYVPHSYDAFFVFSIMIAAGGALLLVGVLEKLVLLLTFITASAVVVHYALARAIPAPILFVLAAAAIVAWAQPAKISEFRRTKVRPRNL